MNDRMIGWIIQQLESSAELLDENLKAADKINPERFQRLVKVTMSLSQLCKQHQAKSA